MGETEKHPNATAVAIVIGVGAERGLGAVLGRRFAAEGCHVLLAGRTADRIERAAAAIVATGGQATAFAADTTREEDVVRLFDRAEALGGLPDLVVFNAGNNRQIPLRDVSAEEFEEFWRVGCFGGFLVAREAARRLAPRGRGTVIFTGASASLRGRSGFAHFAAAKSGLRSIAQSMAREFGPLGLHVAHVVIDGAINGDRVRARMPQIVEQRGEDGLLDIDAIADAYWHIHRQPATAWTHELDLRPWKESF
jgi:NAD(P)-dependent dehydrogenase (short-subunit alcohol dehydrogenase family)